ncbi:hypothetical protein Tco_1445957 [Tanacetum coccineum]
MATTTTTLLPPPPPQQQRTIDSALVARVTALEQICTNFEKKNKVQDQTAQALSSRIFVTPPNWVAAEYEYPGALHYRSISQDMRTTSKRVV